MATDDVTPPPEADASDRRAPDPWRESVDARLAAGKVIMEKLQADSKKMSEDLEANTQATQRTEANTAEVVDLLHSIKGAFHVLEMIGKLVRPLGYLAGAGAAFWGLFSAIKGGGAPK